MEIEPDSDMADRIRVGHGLRPAGHEASLYTAFGMGFPVETVLRNLVLVFVIAGGVLHLFQRLKLPSIAGLVVAGVLIGPFGIGILRDRQQIEVLAQIGILLLMFSIGLDFTRERLRELLYAAGIGTAQILFCVALTTFVAAAFLDRWVEAVFLGFLVAHTSSALMLKLFLDRGDLTSPPVRLGLGISITQDLSVVLMLIAVPMMARGHFVPLEVASMLLRAAGVFAVAFVLARWAIPYWMDHVVRSRSRELFLIFLIVAALGTAWLTMIAGLSLGLGAFLAGLAIAESGYSHHTLSEVAPFRDLLISVFFISIGMLLDLGVLVETAWLAAVLLVVVLVIKFLSGFVPVLIWGYPLSVATTVGASIAQIGEFAFVLGHQGMQAGLIRDDLHAVFLVVAVASMVASPFLVSSSSPVARILGKMPWLRRIEGRRLAGAPEEQIPLRNHVIIAGYGLNGRNLASALKTLGLPFTVLDMNPDTAQAARRRGEPVFFGDCSRVEVLRKLHIDAARGLVLAISDPHATRQAVQIARIENPQIHIIARTRYMTEIDALRELGADEVIAEEFETSLEVLTLTLRLFEVSNASIDRIIDGFRSNAYRALRGELPSSQRERLLTALAPEFDFETHELSADQPAAGKTLRDLDLRARTGATLLAVRRDSALIAVPPADFQLKAGDVLVLAGKGPQIANALRAVAGNDDATGQNRSV